MNPSDLSYDQPLSPLNVSKQPIPLALLTYILWLCFSGVVMPRPNTINTVYAQYALNTFQYGILQHHLLCIYMNFLTLHGSGGTYLNR